MLEEPAHHRLVERLGVGIVAVRLARHVIVDHRIYQQLVQRQGDIPVTRHHRHHGRKVAAGAFAGHGDGARIAIEFGGMFTQPQVGSISIVGRRRKLVLGGLVIVHRYHDCLRCHCQGPRRCIVVDSAGDDEAAAMEIQYQWKRPLARRRIDVNRKIAERTGDVAMRDGDLRARRGRIQVRSQQCLDGSAWQGLLARFFR